MSEQEKRAVKNAVEDFLTRIAGDSVTASEVGAHAERVTGLAFGLTTIGKYIAGFGWVRTIRPSTHGASYYRRPR
jgi:hypothetical protein